MTSGQAVKYKGSVDCAIQIMKNEGFMSMMKGAGKFCFFNQVKLCCLSYFRLAYTLVIYQNITLVHDFIDFNLTNNPS